MFEYIYNNLGLVVTTVSVLFGAISWFVATKIKLRNLGREIQELKTEIKEAEEKQWSEEELRGITKDVISGLKTEVSNLRENNKDLYEKINTFKEIFFEFKGKMNK